MSRVAVVLFNLGGPDQPDAVEPFLFNLFNDSAIIELPRPFRWLVAKLISRRRAPVAREIYAEIGGRSPLLPNTQLQAAALKQALAESATEFDDFSVHIAMRYWHPLTKAAVVEVKAAAPDRIILLPLYPQFSKTTSGSSIALWRQEAAVAGLTAPSTTVCCYPQEPGFVAEAVKRIRQGMDAAKESGPPRLLFSAHGLPKKIVAAGDPYQWQVEQSAKAIVTALALPDLDWRVCYQSRVGPLEWIGPATDDEIRRAGQDGVPLVIFPVAFVSEHSETLVELDIEYAKLAAESGVPGYHRVATVDDGADFIQGLARLVQQALASDKDCLSAAGSRLCPGHCQRCPLPAGDQT